ncbi:efflux RND transporter permease subunit [candidate division FCPU426 bacterium]|nr:efflux RND transporter permease subunit [candidate division FCPU426 bacterium]
MEKIVQYFIDRKLLVYLISILVIAAGVVAATGLRRQILPDVDMLIVQISTIYPAASARDVEVNVTLPLEEKILEVDGLKKVRSVSMENYSQISINLDPDAEDHEKVRADIRRAVDQVTDLPKEITDRPDIAEWDTSWIPVVIIGLNSQTLPEERLRQISRRMEKEIEGLPGVAHVDKLSYRDREIKVQVSPERLREYFLSLSDVIEAIRNRNIRLTGGSLESYADATTVLTLAEFTHPQEIAEVIVRSNFEGQRLTIANLAVLDDGYKDRHFEHRIKGKECIALRIHKKKSADSIKVMEEVDQYLQSMQKSLPQELNVIKTRDNTRITRRRLGILGNNAVIGFVLLMAILVVFLNLRVAFWTAMGIPFALGVGFMAHALTGGSIDSVSIMVFILVLGMLVDDAIVVAENIHRHQENGMPVMQAALRGVTEVAAPVAATVSTTIVAFLPLFSLGGMLGLFIRMIPIIVIGTLLGSLLESFFILPSHLAAGGVKSANWKEKGALADPLFISLRRFYKNILKKALRNRYQVVLGGLLFLGLVTYMATNHLKFILFPQEGAEELYVHIETPVGSSFAATRKKVAEVEALLSALPKKELLEFESWVGMDQSIAGDEMYGDNLAMIYFRLNPYGERLRLATEIVEDLRAATSRLEGFEQISFEIDSGGPPVGRAVELNIVGDDPELQKAALDEVLGFLRGLPGVIDPDADLKFSRDEEVIHIDQDELARRHLTVAQVANTVRMAFEGEVVTSVRFKQEEVDIRVRLDEKSRQTKRTLHNLQVRNHMGNLIPLRAIISLERRPVLQGIRHYLGQRVVTVAADVDTHVTTSNEVNEKVLEKFADVSRRYPGIRIITTGEAAESAEVMHNMGKAGFLAVLAIYSILVIVLNSLTQPLIILVAIPFGLIGVILAFWAHGMAMGFLAVIGILGMSGVVVNDSLIILSFINHLALERKELGHTMHETILDAAETRLRPVILTTLTTAVALLPTAYGFGGSDPFIQPMVMAMLWGITFATALTLFWVPTLYAIGQDIKVRLKLTSRGAKPLPSHPPQGMPRRDSGRRPQGTPGRRTKGGN